MEKTPRIELLNTISQFILTQQLSHPIRVGVDGITASGKSTFVRELSSLLHQSQRKVITTTLDGFHNPRIQRYARGRESAEGYYYDAYNYNEIIKHLLIPLGEGGNLLFKTQVFDLKADEPIELEPTLALSDSILVVDGSFALRRELQDYWDVGIYLNVDYNIAEERAAIRDADDFGSATEAKRITHTRYHGAHKIHTQMAKPMNVATFVVDNNEPIKARILTSNGI